MRRLSPSLTIRLLGPLLVCLATVPARGQSPEASSPLTASGGEESFEESIEPILADYCFGCHADGAREGDFSFDEFVGQPMDRQSQHAWWAVMRNLRADIMPPAGEWRPDEDERKQLFDWIQTYVFRSDRQQPDPGRVVLRRLNRLEYRNTIRDLMGVDFDTSVEFPPDDSGDGFDNNADALTISPLLAEKYIEAARAIVDQAVPKQTRVMPVERLGGDRFRGESGDADRLSLDEAAEVSGRFRIDREGEYRVVLQLAVRGSFDFDPDRARFRCTLDGEPLLDKEYAWQPRHEESHAKVLSLSAGDHELNFKVEPLPPEDPKSTGGKDTFVRVEVEGVRIEGPLDPQQWRHPEGYERFFHLPEPPQDPEARLAYAGEILQRFCGLAYRRPVEPAHIDRLLQLAGFMDSSGAPLPQSDEGPTFEEQIGLAMTAVLSSPRFLFRVERPIADSTDRFPLIDEYSLASRLSYLFWSTMPDERLRKLAAEGKLRDELDAEIDRLLADPRSEAMIANFVGQWLQTRDVDGVSIDALAALGVREEYDEVREYLESTPTGRRPPPQDASSEHREAYERYRELRGLRVALDQELRSDMRAQTEGLFAKVVREDRSLTELIDADYELLNERLAEHYGITGRDGAAIEGEELRPVDLPEDSPFGGILTQGTFLMVTSNPTRTSPVKRGLFILDNVLGTPAPPAPANVPELEASAEQADPGKEPTLRELLEIHRSEPLCRSCHARFDPLGLAFENFTAIGTWRDQEGDQPIDPSGELITGESFSDVRELKSILVGSRRADVYRCLAERFLAYALGRGLSFQDEVTLDQIVGQLEANQGRVSALIRAAVHSVPFQRQRRIEP